MISLVIDKNMAVSFSSGPYFPLLENIVWISCDFCAIVYKMNESDILKSVTGRLNQSGIAYMISGSVALSFYAKPRMTRDIDIVISIKNQDIDKMMELFEADFYIDRDMMTDAVAKRSMFNIIHYETLVKVDFIIKKDDEYRLLEFENKKKIEFRGDEIYVVSLEDLIISKLYWAKDSLSEIQINDILNLMESGFDQSYVEKWCSYLNLNDILKKVRDERHK